MKDLRKQGCSRRATGRCSCVSDIQLPFIPNALFRPIRNSLVKKKIKEIFLFVFLLNFIIVELAWAKNYRSVAFVASSTQYDESKLEQIKQAFEKKGYLVSMDYLNQSVSDFGYVNTDKSRANALIAALLAKDIDILWMLRGGGGAINLIPQLYAAKNNLKKVKPKILVGFSDVTAIHYFLNTVLAWPSVHAVTALYNRETAKFYSSPIGLNDQENIPSINNLLVKGVYYKQLIPLNPFALMPTQGVLLGGNLTLLQTFFSTRYEHDFGNNIVILEDTGVSFRQLDRSLHQLLYKPNFKPKAIIFGQFYSLDPTDEERLMYKTVLTAFAKQTNIPVYYFPYFGHGRQNKAFILGALAAIHCPEQQEYCVFKQPKLAFPH